MFRIIAYSIYYLPAETNKDIKKCKYIQSKPICIQFKKITEKRYDCIYRSRFIVLCIMPH